MVIQELSLRLLDWTVQTGEYERWVRELVLLERPLGGQINPSMNAVRMVDRIGVNRSTTTNRRGLSLKGLLC